MKPRRRSCSCLFLRLLPLALLLVVASLARAGGPPPAAEGTDLDPKKLIEDRHARIRWYMKEARGLSDDEIREEIRKVLMSFVDFDRVAERALKRYYGDLPAEKKRSYVVEFRKLVQATYVKRLKPGNDYAFSFRGEPEERKGKVRVRTLFKTSTSEAYVDYLLLRLDDGRYRAYDIVIDEVSMARNYRGEFYKLMKSKGFDGLIARIRERTRQKESEWKREKPEGRSKAGAPP